MSSVKLYDYIRTCPIAAINTFLNIMPFFRERLVKFNFLILLRVFRRIGEITIT